MCKHAKQQPSLNFLFSERVRCPELNEKKNSITEQPPAPEFIIFMTKYLLKTYFPGEHIGISYLTDQKSLGIYIFLVLILLKNLDAFDFLQTKSRVHSIFFPDKNLRPPTRTFYWFL